MRLSRVALLFAATLVASTVLWAAPLGPATTAGASVTSVDVWPALGTTVTLQDGLTTITAAGARLVLTDEIRSLLRSGRLLTRDPQPGSTSILDYPTAMVDSGAPITVSDLTSRAGTYHGQVVVTNAYDTSRPRGGGAFRWDGASVTTADGGTVLGQAGVGRWHRLYNGSIDATWFGAVGDGVTNDMSALRAASAAIPDGGALYIPAGDYAVSGFLSALVPPSNSTIFGDGPATYIHQVQRHAMYIVDLNGKSNVEIRGLKFQYDLYVNFQSVIRGDSASEIDVHNCYFTHGEPGSIQEGDQMPAIVLQDCSNVGFHHNTVYYLQAKAAGSNGGDRINVSDNLFYEPYNIAVSVVGSNVGTYGTTDVIVARNIVTNAHSEASFFLGSDGENATNAYWKRILIVDNVVNGTQTSVQHVGILADFALASEDVVVARNVLRMTDGRAADNATYAILLKSGINSPVYGRVSVIGNHVYGLVDQAGIEVQGAGQGLLIAHNQLSKSRGIRVYADGGNLTDLTIADNIVSNVNVQGILVHARTGSIFDANVHDNTVKDVTGAGVFDAGFNTVAADTYAVTGTWHHNRAANNTGVTTTDYGIREAVTGTGAITARYLDNDMTGVAVRGYNLTAAATGRGNKGTGFVTQARGIADADTGATSVTVTHGLSHRSSADGELMDPTTTHIVVHLLRPTSGAAAVTATVDTASITSTQFVARFSAALAADDYKLDWTATAAEFSP